MLDENMSICKPFQERRVIARAHTHTRTKAFRKKCDELHTQIKLLTTRVYNIMVCVWSRYVPNFMLLFNRRLSLIIKLTLRSCVFWFCKLLILLRNQKGFLLSPVYKHLKSIFGYARNEKGTLLKKTSHT